MEIILDDAKLLANDHNALDAGIAGDTVASVVFKPKRVICTNQHAIASLGGVIDSDLLLVVGIRVVEIRFQPQATNLSQ